MTPLDPNEHVTVRLRAQDWNSVLAALHEMPYRLANPLVASILEQVRDHQQQETRADVSS
jgi:hypothetical protein